MIIAVDFDETLKINHKPNTALFQFLIQRQMMGDCIILYTCREGKSLQDAISFSAKNGLQFNLVNENHPMAISMLGHNSRKIYADIYIDDKAMKP